MPLTRLELLPLSVFVLLPGTFIVTYVISILLHHVEVEFPYISDTGTYTPESCIFGQLLNLCAVLMMGTVYVRFKQVEQYYRDHLSSESPKVLKMNTVSLWFGWTASLGVSLVANFQETAVFAVHLIGAFMAFGVGMFYTWLQTVMSFRMHPLVNSIRMARFRFILSLIITVAFISTAATATMSMLYFHGTDKTKWKPTDGGYGYHVASTVSEWTIALATDAYLLTFVRELRNICMVSPRVEFVIESNHSNPGNEIFRSSEQLEVPDVNSVNFRPSALSGQIVTRADIH